jgi:FMN phosphatase YigB (HAD superfamily)
LAIRAVVFDIGGVLERVDDYESVLSAPWRERLGMSPDDFAAALAAIDPAGLSETGQMSESEWADRCATCLGLSPGQQQEFVADVWDWYCGELDVELMTFAASLRPRGDRADRAATCPPRAPS